MNVLMRGGLAQRRRERKGRVEPRQWGCGQLGVKAVAG